MQLTTIDENLRVRLKHSYWRLITDDLNHQNSLFVRTEKEVKNSIFQNKIKNHF
jgi:hypothetical protein